MRGRECFCVRQDGQHVGRGQSFSCGAQSDDARFNIRCGTSEGCGNCRTRGDESDVRAVFAESLDGVHYPAVDQLRWHIQRDL